MNRKKRKLTFIKIKNSWKEELKKNDIIDITTSDSFGFVQNPKHPRNKIMMDFKNKEEIIKYGVMKVG